MGEIWPVQSLFERKKHPEESDEKNHFTIVDIWSRNMGAHKTSLESWQPPHKKHGTKLSKYQSKSQDKKLSQQRKNQSQIHHPNSKRTEE